MLVQFFFALRVGQFEEVVEALFAHHDDGQLNAKLTKTTGRITDVTFKPQNFITASIFISRMFVEPSLVQNKTSFLMINYDDHITINMSCLKLHIFSLRKLLYQVPKTIFCLCKS